MEITFTLGPITEDEVREVIFSLISSAVPQQEIAYYQADNFYSDMASISTHLPYLKALRFQEAPNGDGEILLPYLQHIALHGWDEGDDLNSFVAFLDRRSSSGNQLDSLEINVPGISLEVAKHLKRVVGKLTGSGAGMCVYCSTL